MFTLRRISKAGLEINTCLGEEYVLVIKETHPVEFTDRVKMWKDHEIDGVYGIVAFENGNKLMPLYETSTYYIMSSDGKTFDNISKK